MSNFNALPGWLWLLLGILIGWLLNWLFCKSKATPPTEENKAVPAVSATAESATEPVPVPEPAAPAKASKPATAPVKTTAFDLASAKANGFAIKVANDLTVIEGVGPKISELFKNHGLGTFALVASASVDDMRAVLEKGGARFRIANPGTWAQQAGLAADNQWAELKKLQTKLSGGKK